MGIFHFSPNLFVAAREKCCRAQEEVGELEGRWCWKERVLRALIQLLPVPLHHVLSNHRCVLCGSDFSLQLLYFPVKQCGSCTGPQWHSGIEVLLRTWWQLLIFVIKTGSTRFRAAVVTSVWDGYTLRLLNFLARVLGLCPFIFYRLWLILEKQERFCYHHIGFYTCFQNKN